VGPAALPTLPAGFTPTRASLHQLAFYVLSPVRREATGRIGLRWIPGGFGTPPFGDDERRLRVDGVHLVAEAAGTSRAEPITTLGRAGEFVGRAPIATDRGEFDVAPMVDPDEPLTVDAQSVAFLDAWLALGTSVLEQLRVDDAAHEPSVVQLWPEHFDLAVEAGSEAHGERAAFGFSPGDDAHADPYVYVAPWQPVDRRDPFWNDTAFNGASLPLAALVAEADPHAAALAFLRHGLPRSAAR
jgi:hypothetical protein